MFWECSCSLHFLVVHNKNICSGKIVIHWHCLRNNIHESIHVNLKLAVMMKPLQLCIFINNFLSFCLWFFFLQPFLCFFCNTLQHIFPPIYDNNYFSFSIRFLILIFDAFVRLASNSLCLVVTARLIFTLFPIKAIHFSSTVKMSYFSVIFPPLITFLVLSKNLNHVIACSFTNI